MGVGVYLCVGVYVSKYLSLFSKKKRPRNLQQTVKRMRVNIYITNLSGTALGPVSLRQYELVYSILVRKYEFPVYLLALSYRNLRGILTRKLTNA